MNFANLFNSNRASSTSSPAKETWESLKERGNNAFKTNLLDEAVACYTDAIAINDTEATLYSNRSAAYLKRNELQLAADDAQKAIELDGLFIKAYTRLHTALCGLGQFGSCSKILKHGLDSFQAAVSDDANKSVMTTAEKTQSIKQLRDLISSAECGETAIQTARKHIQEGSMQTASRVLAQSLRDFPSCAVLAFLFAEATAPSTPDEISQLLARFNNTHGNDVYYIYLRALVLYYRGSDFFANAQTLLRSALEMDPDNTKAAVLLKKIRTLEMRKAAGNTAFKQKRPRDAVREYTAAIQVDPLNERMNATLHGNQAAAKMDLKDFEGALLDCNYAIDHGTQSAKMYARRSRVQEHLENYDAALQDLQKACELDSTFEAELRQLKVRARRSKRKNYYKTLGLTQGENDQEVIRRGYKKTCLQWHPDKWAHASETERNLAEERFKEVGEAFAVLSNPEKKQMYDSGRIDSEAESQTAGYAQPNADIANMINMMFGMGAGGGSERQGVDNAAARSPIFSPFSGYVMHRWHTCVRNGHRAFDLSEDGVFAPLYTPPMTLALIHCPRYTAARWESYAVNPVFLSLECVHVYIYLYIGTYIYVCFLSFTNQ